MAESVEQWLAQLTAQTGPSAAIIYAKWAALTVPAGGEYTLEELVRRKLTANGKSAQIRETLLATIKAGGAVGESTEQCLAKSGLAGWS